MMIPVIRVRLPRSLRFLVVVSLLALPWLTTSRCFGQENPPQTEEQRQAREALDKGVQVLKNGQYDEAIAEFTRAKQLDPQLLNAHLYLATAYASQYIPGAPSEQNRRIGEAAVVEYREVMNVQPENLPAIDGVGSLLFQMAGQPYDPAKFAEAKSHFQKHIQVKPEDPEPRYWVGVIDWTLSFRANGELRAGYNQTVRAEQLRDTDPLPVELREEYMRDYGPIIDEGIEALKHAIELKPDYDDAMAYLNLLYRRKADTVASETEREKLIETAEDLVDQVKDIKQKRVEASSQP
jgi:tetratricopeptide (TPR) repeat protein